MTEGDDKSNNRAVAPNGADNPSVVQNKNDIPDIDEGLSKVAVSKSQNIIFFIALVVVIGCVIYFSFFDDDNTAKKPVQEVTNIHHSVKPPMSESLSVQVPDVPTVPKLTAPAQVAAPPPKLNEQLPPTIKIASNPVVAPPAPAPKPNFDSIPLIKKTQESDTRRKSSISLLSGSINSNVVEAGGLQYPSMGKSPNQRAATFMGDLNYIIAQGKMVDATIESAISTDLKGLVRAIISRDVYAESGKNILLPKGSRVIGQYKNTVSIGQNRIEITWDRVIRPDGVDINIASLATDSLGRSGVTGRVDTGYFQAFTSVILSGGVNYLLAREADKVQNKQNANPNNPQNVSLQGYFMPNTPGQNPAYVPLMPGYMGQAYQYDPVSKTYVQSIINPNFYRIAVSATSPNNNVSTAAQSIQQTEKDIADLTKNIINENLKMGPKIYVDQGTPIKIFVQNDLVFPSHLNNNLRVIQ